ncbi:MAG: DUF1127 domain-containing protein [Salaquimonas sp.]
MSNYVADKFAGKPAFHPVAYHSARAEITAPLSAKFAVMWKRLIRIVSTYHQQRIDRVAFHHVVALDDRQLDDIGVTRSDVIWASNLPLSQNAALELEKLARSRNRQKR